ncbi:MAG: dienelactone hydrolase family protein, partial [Acidobacteriota bacterium]|nr:dienelactone hydrolase family protein [Acidobacteriota bacterium]
MRSLVLNIGESPFSKILLLVSLITFTSCASALHANSNQQMDHHPGSGSASESSQASEAQDWAKQHLAKSPRHQEWVKVKYKPGGSNSEREISAFIVYPEVKTKATAVIVIHEIFGMSDWVQSLTDQLAGAGYVAIAPDLLSGMGPNGGGTTELRAVD